MRIRQLPITDAFTRGVETVLMIDSQVMLLSPIASLVWQAAASESSIEDVTTLAVATFGSPDGADPLSLIQVTVQELEAVGAVTRF